MKDIPDQRLLFKVYKELSNEKERRKERGKRREKERDLIKDTQMAGGQVKCDKHFKSRGSCKLNRSEVPLCTYYAGQNPKP